MWIEKGDVVTLSDRRITGRVIRLMKGVPRAVVRYLDPRGGYRFVSEHIHFDELRLATKFEVAEFSGETKRRMTGGVSA